MKRSTHLIDEKAKYQDIINSTIKYLIQITHPAPALAPVNSQPKHLTSTPTTKTNKRVSPLNAFTPYTVTITTTFSPFTIQASNLCRDGLRWVVNRLLSRWCATLELNVLGLVRHGAGVCAGRAVAACLAVAVESEGGHY